MANVRPSVAPGIGQGKMTDTTEQPQAVSDEIRLAEIELARDKARWVYRRVIWVALIASLGVAIVTGLFQYGQAVREAALEDKKFTNSLKLEKRKFEFSSALELRQTSNAYLKDFLNEALGDNLERRVKFAEYFATMTEDDVLRARWETYHKRVEKTFRGKLEDERSKEIEKTAEVSKLVESRVRAADLVSKIETLEEKSVERKKLKIDLVKVREEAKNTAAMIATLHSKIEILKRDTSPQPTGGTSRGISHPLALAVEAELPITAGNVATKMGDNLWNWTVFIQAPVDVLAQVQCVEYTLHSTFQNPVKKVCKRGSNEHAFALNASGWGTFPIKIRVLLKDGRNQFLAHILRF